jgi:ribosome-interacting GTPase 1
MARTQKNKATMGHLGLLKAKLAKLRRELITPKGGGGGGPGEGFDVAKTGDARVGFVGMFFLPAPNYRVAQKNLVHFVK